MNLKALRSKMILNGDNGGSLAKYLNITRTTLSYKMNGTHGTEFRQQEIQKIMERYNLTAEEMVDIFFD